MTANRDADGSASLSSSTYFWLSPGTKLVSPVMFPPGRARLATNPCATGSGTTSITMGMVAVASRMAFVSRVPVVTTTSTLAWTRAESRSGRPSPNASWTARFCPFT
jgi:hypothetical protein